MRGDFYITEKFNYSAIRAATTFPLFVVFKDPIDYPGKFVVRVFDVNQPTSYCAVKDNYKDAIDTIPEFLNKIPRDPKDDYHILETWM